MLTKEDLAHQIRDALHRFYDPVHMQTHPLADHLVPNRTPRETRGEALRRVLRAAIESLRPSDDIPYGEPEWWGYRILWMRFVEGLSPDDAARELHLGRTAFYERQQQALDAVVSVLWERYHQQVADTDAATPAPDDDQRRAALESVRRSPRAAAAVGDIVGRVQQALSPLCRSSGVALTWQVQKELPPIYCDPAIVAQVMIGLVMSAMQRASQRRLVVGIASQRDRVVWRFSALPRAQAEAMVQTAEAELAADVLAIYGGRLWIEAAQERLEDGGERVVCVALPSTRPSRILLIDDDRETCELFQRYLSGNRYTVSIASSPEQVQACLASEEAPDLIVLDVLMPGQGGWEVLQRLKTLPETTHVPVIICSILRQPSLALALGAEKVLQKPVTRDALIGAIDELLGQQSAPHRSD